MKREKKRKRKERKKNDRMQTRHREDVPILRTNNQPMHEQDMLVFVRREGRKTDLDEEKEGKKRKDHE